MTLLKHLKNVLKLAVAIAGWKVLENIVCTKKNKVGIFMKSFFQYLCSVFVRDVSAMRKKLYEDKKNITIKKTKLREDAYLYNLI